MSLLNGMISGAFWAPRRDTACKTDELCNEAVFQTAPSLEQCRQIKPSIKRSSEMISFCDLDRCEETRSQRSVLEVAMRNTGWIPKDVLTLF